MARTKTAKPVAAFRGLPIIERLAAKHREDVFVPECKNGPTWSHAHIRLDAWAMKRSYAHPCMYGYEIKMTRSDFLADQKWPSYLPLCNEFSFVAPKGLISIDELPTEVGLIEAIGVKRLITRRKAAHRQATLDLKLAIYLLMSRTIVARHEPADKLALWQEWLDRQAKCKEMGYHVGKVTQEKYTREVLTVRQDNEHLQREVEQLSEVKDFLATLGVPVPKGGRYQGPETTIRALRTKAGHDIIDTMKQTSDAVAKWLLEVGIV